MPTKKTDGSHNGHAATCETMEPTRASGSNLMSPTKVLNDVEARFDDPAVEADLDELEELEQAGSAPAAMVVPVVVPPTRRPTEDDDEDEPISPQRKMLLEHLIDMADQYSFSGSPRQAIELYFELVIDHAGTEQSVQASERLLAVARQYKNNGELRQARGIYERLLKAS